MTCSRNDVLSSAVRRYREKLSILKALISHRTRNHFSVLKDSDNKITYIPPKLIRNMSDFIGPLRYTIEKQDYRVVVK